MGEDDISLILVKYLFIHVPQYIIYDFVEFD